LPSVRVAFYLSFNITLAQNYLTLAMLSIIAVLAISGFFLTKQIELYIRQRKFIRQHGCRPVAQLPQKDRLFGLDTLFESYEAFKNNKYLQQSQRLFEQNGNTFAFRALGKTEINTCDPEKSR
jgi:hypothetical protein